MSALRPPLPRVLLVDDDEAVGRAIARLLRDVADVTPEASPQAARERLRQGERYDLVLCDVLMPGMSGVQLFEDVVTRAPELRERFVFASGGVSGRVATQLAATGRPCIDKPMTKQAVVALLPR